MKHIDKTLLRKYCYEDGLPLAEMARRFGVCKITVHRRIKKLGFENRKKPSLVEDLTNQTINNLTFIKYVKNDRFGKAVWLCKCHCGKEKLLNASAIKANLTTSCGCNKRKNLSTGYELISGAFWNKLRKSALSRDIEFTITIEEAWEIFLRQNKQCALSGVSLTMVSNNDRSLSQTASPDRIDSTKGYTKNNFQWVHKRINRIKNILSVDELIFWSRLIQKKTKGIVTEKYNPDVLAWE